MLVISARQAKKEKARRNAIRSLRHFYRLFFARTLEPGTDMVWGIPHEAMAVHLEALFEGEIRYLLITLPPALGKTNLVSNAFPAWCWLRRPAWRFLCGMFQLNPLGIKHQMRRRQLVESPLYGWLKTHPQAVEEAGVRDDYGELVPWAKARASWGKEVFKNSAEGFMRAVSPEGGGGGLGDHADVQVLDDPMDPLKLSNDGLRKTTSWLEDILNSRWRNRSLARRVMVMQRLHKMDPAAWQLADRSDTVHLNLPNEWEPRLCITVPNAIGWSDPRSQPGELLCPELLNREETDREKRDHARYTSQYQQDPTSAAGKRIDKKWWRRWRSLEGGRGRLVGSWDTTQGVSKKGTKGHDFVVGQVWCIDPPHAYLVDQFRRRMTPVETEIAFLAMTEKWPSCGTWLVENKSTGPQLITSMRRRLPGVLPFDPKGTSDDRALGVSSWIFSGHCSVPAEDAEPLAEMSRPTGAFLNEAQYKRLRADEREAALEIVEQVKRWAPGDWVPIFLEEWANVPGPLYDDCVDAATQVLLWTEIGDEREEPASPAEATAPKRQSPEWSSDRRSWKDRYIGH